MIEWILGRWREAPRPPARSIAVAPPPQPSRVPAKYQSLYAYLENRYAVTVVLTFEQMEALLGSALPEQARTDGAWWTDVSTRQDAHADAWTIARRTAVPNLPAGIVTFERQP